MRRSIYMGNMHEWEAVRNARGTGTDCQLYLQFFIEVTEFHCTFCGPLQLFRQRCQRLALTRSLCQAGPVPAHITSLERGQGVAIYRMFQRPCCWAYASVRIPLKNSNRVFLIMLKQSRDARSHYALDKAHTLFRRMHHFSYH